MKAIGLVSLGILLMLLTATTVFSAEDDTPKIIVQGEGKVSVPADKVTVVLGVETRDASAAKAAFENAQLMNETIAALLAAGVAESEIRTSIYSLSSSQAEQSVGSEMKVGHPEFIASNMVTFSLINTSGVGEVLDAAVSSGSNGIREISFDLLDARPQKDLALTRAIEDASRKAETASRAAGVNLSRILEISEGYGYVSAGSKSVAFDASTPIQPGDLEITASVTMTYEIS